MSTSPLIPANTRLLKAHDVRGLGSKVAFNFDDLKQQGQAYLDATQAQAGEMLATARRDADSIRQQAQRDAFAEGQSQGMADAQRQIESRAAELAAVRSREALAKTLPAMQAAAEALVVERDRWLGEWEASAVRLAATIAERLVRKQLAAEPRLAIGMIREALELAAGTPEIRLRLHPEDAELLHGHDAEISSVLARCGSATVVPDAAISRGGCVIDSRHGRIDGRIETMLDRIVAELAPENI